MTILSNMATGWTQCFGLLFSDKQCDWSGFKTNNANFRQSLCTKPIDINKHYDHPNPASLFKIISMLTFLQHRRSISIFSGRC